MNNKRVLEPSKDDVRRLLPEYEQIYIKSVVQKPQKFIEAVKILRTPASYSPAPPSDYAVVLSFSYNVLSGVLTEGPAFSYDTMISTGVDPYERTVTVPTGMRVWVVCYDGSWGGYWSYVHVYLHEFDFMEFERSMIHMIEPKIELSERQLLILGTIRSYVPTYRRELFRKHHVTVGELDELRFKGYIDRRGSLTSLGKLAARDAKDLYRHEGLL